MQSRSKASLFWPIIGVITVVDVVTKAMAERMLLPRGIPNEVFGNTVRLTLVYNPGAAFGFNLGPYSRWIFTVLTIVALVVLWRLYRSTSRHDAPRAIALGLVCAGAVGNLIDRLRSPFGVVDFLDIGIGDVRWPTFNVADMAVSVGAALLAWVLWQEDRAAMAESERVAQGGVPASASGGKPGDLV
jgi:signal peptidase II